MAKGFIYVLVSDSVPDMCKIGATEFSTPEHRAAQISGGTGVATSFKVAASFAVEDCFHAENRIHEGLAHLRVHKRKEFFRCSADYAIEFITQLIGGVAIAPTSRPASYRANDLPFSRLFATFPDDGSDRALSIDEQIACKRVEESLRNAGR